MSQLILFIDDDQLAAEALCAALRDHGFTVDYVSSVPEALSCVRRTVYDLAIVDLMMPSGGLGFLETRGGFETGIALARRLRQTSETLKILGITQRETPDAIEWFGTHADGLCSKSDALQNPRSLVRRVAVVLQTAPFQGLRAFIVHGHDLALRDELKTLLQADFGLTAVVLDEQAWRGRTLIEKFEDEAMDVDVVFVLLTPDDLAIDRQKSREHRARQNVLLELGYFLGRLARRRGRVVLLRKGDVTIPSDLYGIGDIDISDGVAAAREAIRRELVILTDRSRS
jgi:predicted nucleotide-binding protein